jgi:hypothetical protein
MSLDYNLLNVRTDLPLESKERDEWWEGIDWNTFTSFVFASIPVGIHHIKDEATAEQFYLRALKYYRVSFCEKPPFNYAFVKDFIGMSTNVSTKTDAAFKQSLLENLSEKVNTILRKELKEQNEN